MALAYRDLTSLDLMMFRFASPTPRLSQQMLRTTPFLTFLCLACTASFAAERPNFIIFIADDMAWNDCGAYGNANVRTPNIDTLARDGMRFDRAYLTCSSCSPSRSSIMTGRYPHSTGAGELHLPLPETQTMMTKSLMDDGYWTAAVGKWHLGDAVADQVTYRKGSPPQKMAEAWVTALRERPRDKPFFLWAAHSDPHRGYKPGAVDPPHTKDDAIVPPFFPDNDEVRSDLALYYDEVSRFDQHIGITLRELEKQGVADNTFVLVMSDNGRPFPYCKTMVHVPGVRTPFIIRWPAGGVKPNTTTNSVVSSLDIAPTVLTLANLKPLDSFQGQSFHQLLKSPDAVSREFAVAEHNWHDYMAFERAVHTSDYCYVRNWLPDTPGTPPADAVNSPTYKSMKKLRAAGSLSPSMEANCFATPRPTEFLYDVKADPHCMNNLAGDSAYAPKLDDLRSKLNTWQSETNDHFAGAHQITPDGFDRDSGARMINGSHPSFQKKKKNNTAKVGTEK